ncbi:FHA domain-containing protein [Nocardioides sp. zg-579]|uniref:FHA domain-containing protein n=1 Tax=Nocardioides marmotae TaxID=2663857 RepID=A0A6I3J9S2_9ACTN|nr:FHA domain-containing protein [Nocardioides marmotae]MCR6030774.1 FHA domain-containing protein [Gordonia jinghuaiqii]MTB94408.1 FHA domain-containing protein [Nocardioides marmotae]QKE01568.1 FHA domain-containing protein [Nocardioides marmotae]
MPFCTACGRQNPDDARFCSQCGTKLATADDATGSVAVQPGQPATSGDSTATIQIGLGEKTETSDRQLNPVDAAAVDALPAGHALLVVQRGPGSGSRFLLDADVVTAGRHPESEIFLDDVTVSRRHAQFDRSGDTFTVSDVGSLNGTYVNRDRIDTVQLKDGDEVQIGKYRLVFFSGHQAG